MKVKDILDLITDSDDICIVSPTYEQLTAYNGKDSIDKCYNDHEVIKINGCYEGGIEIMIAT